MHILGISGFYHDSAAAIVRDGVPIACAQEERFTRRKHDPSFPKRSSRFCLRQAGIEADELDWVVFYEKPLLKFQRILITQLQAFPKSARAFSKAMFLWLGDRLWLKNRLANELGVDPGRVLFTTHHRSHAASAFYPSPFEEAAILTADGVGEWATTSLAHGQGTHIEDLAEVHFPNSLGLLYSAITAFLGYEVNEGEQKVMAMAALGEPHYEEQMRSLVHQDTDASYLLKLAPFRFHYDPESSFGPGLEELLGPPRRPGDGPPEQRHFDIAASLQLVFEDTLLHLARELHRRLDCPNLCLAGGVALNVVANTRVLREGPFDHLFIQPAAGDAGGALGAALEIYHAVHGGPRGYRQEHAFLGAEVVPEPRGEPERLADDAAVVQAMARRLAEGETVGWVRGAFEWGPRSLGHRSLLADCSRPEMRQRINRTIKTREPFRPYAPSVPAERAAEYFDIPEGGEWPARFMLIAAKVKEAGRRHAAAALHADGTARVQLVHREVDPLFHQLLTQFGKLRGAPILLNTSLNLRGEPIVRTEADALALFERSRLDALVVEERLYTRDAP